MNVSHILGPFPEKQKSRIQLDVTLERLKVNIIGDFLRTVYE